MKAKKFLLLLVTIFFTSCENVHSGEFVPQSVEFKAFLEKFPDQNTPIYSYSYYNVDVAGFDSMTQFAGDMWERHLLETEVNQFVKGSVPIDMQSICYLGCMAGARVKSKMLQDDKYVLLAIVKDNELGCGEENFLIVYNRKGEVEDYLVYFGNYSENDIPVPYSICSRIEDNNITVFEKKYFYKLENGKKKYYKTVYTKRKYVISDKGKFVMTSEEVSEKMEQ